MDLVKPRERILKKVRSALIGRSDSNLRADNPPKIPNTEYHSPTASLVELLVSLGHSAQVCSNKYDFLDKLLGHLEEQSGVSVICTDPRIQAHLDSCGQIYFEEETIGVGNAEPLCTAKMAVAETGTIVPSLDIDQLPTRPRVYIIHQEQVISTIKTLFDKFKYRLSQGEEGSISVVQPGSIDSEDDQRMVFFILKDNK